MPNNKQRIAGEFYSPRKEKLCTGFDEACRDLQMKSKWIPGVVFSEVMKNVIGYRTPRD